MRRLLLLLTLTGASLDAQRAAPRAAAPLASAELTRLFAEAVPYAVFVAGDTTKRAQWEAGYAAGPAVARQALDEGGVPPGRWRLLVVAESGCNDAVNSIPYLARLAEAMPGAELRLLRKADGAPILRRHTVGGREATPVVVVLDGAFRERGAWIERPAAQQAFVRANEKVLGEDSLWTVVRRMRAEDGGRSAVREVLALMRGAATATRGAGGARTGPATGARAGASRSSAAKGAERDSAKPFVPVAPCKLP